MFSYKAITSSFHANMNHENNCSVRVFANTQIVKAQAVFPSDPHTSRFTSTPLYHHSAPPPSQSLLCVGIADIQYDSSQKKQRIKILFSMAQSIFVYTASQGPAVCPALMVPHSLRTTPLCEGLKLISTAPGGITLLLFYNELLKLPSMECTLYRGLNIPLSDMSYYFRKDAFIWLRTPTSTTTDKDGTMAKFGQGVIPGAAATFMQLIVKNAKGIALNTFSAVASEQERLIPHNTCFRVLVAVSAADRAACCPHADLIAAKTQRTIAR